MATFGKLTDGASSSSSSVDKKVVSTATPSSSGTVVDMRTRLWVSSGSTTVRGVIYSDSAGSPSALLAVTDDLVISNTSEAENTLTFSGANLISITNGTPYWIGVHWADPGAPTITFSRDNTASLRTENDTDVFAGGSSDPFGTILGTFTGPIDCYVNYTEATSSKLTLLGVG